MPGFLAGGGVTLVVDGPAVAEDPVGAWHAHAAAMQALLDGPDADREFSHPMAGTHPLNAAIDQFYTVDVFMHTWDLARATGQDDTLDPTLAARAAGRDAADRRDAARPPVSTARRSRWPRTHRAGPADGLHRPRPGLAAVTTAAAIVRDLHASADPGEHAKVLARVGDPAAVIGVRMRDVFDPGQAPLDPRARRDRRPARRAIVRGAHGGRQHPRPQGPGPGRLARDRRAWAALYLNRHDRLDQWDLVDRAAPRVIGGWLLAADPAERRVLTELAASPDPNRRRTAITATFWLVRHGQAGEALDIAARLVDDPEPLVRNSVAVALREVGRLDADRRDAFLAAHPTRCRPGPPGRAQRLRSTQAGR